MTEGEAKLRWCPFARVLAVMVPKGMEHSNDAPQLSANASFNRQVAAMPGELTKLPNAAACVASACMAWRKITRGQQFRVTHSGKTDIWNWDPTGHKNYDNVVVEKIENNEGYCGLAGKT